MPHLRGVTVHVTNSHGESLQEWGVQYLRQNTGESKVSAYVQSTTDVAFQISLQPDIPFLDHVSASDSSRGGNRSRRKKTTRLADRSEDRSVEQSHEKTSNDALFSLVPSSTTSRSPPTPDFAFLAVLYLDGRTIPERKISKASFYFFHSFSIASLFAKLLHEQTQLALSDSPNMISVQVPIYTSGC